MLAQLAGRKALIGMIHVGALPGTPRAAEPVDALASRAVQEAQQYERAGFTALLLENMHDVPYLNGAVGPEVVAALAVIGAQVRRECPLPLGVQILAAANQEALAVAHAIGADFVRVENFAYAHVADEGLMPVASAGPLLRYRRQIGAERIAILADVKKKHSSHAITQDVDIAEAARTAEFFGADGVIVTGGATAQPADPREIAAVRGAVRGLVAVGSGITPENLAAAWPHAELFIVGSSAKRDGRWDRPIDEARLAALVAAAGRLGYARS